VNRLREHILFGNEHYSTLKTGCGRAVSYNEGMVTDGVQVLAPYYTCGLGIAHREPEFMAMVAGPGRNPYNRMCGTCVRSIRAVYRRRGDKFPALEVAR